MAYREGIMEHTLRSHLQQLSSILSPVRTARMSSLQQFWEFDPAGMASIPLLASTQSWKSAERLALGLLSHWTALAAVEKLNERQRQILDTAL